MWTLTLSITRIIFFHISSTFLMKCCSRFNVNSHCKTAGENLNDFSGNSNYVMFVCLFVCFKFSKQKSFQSFIRFHLDGTSSWECRREEQRYTFIKRSFTHSGLYIFELSSQIEALTRNCFLNNYINAGYYMVDRWRKMIVLVILTTLLSYELVAVIRKFAQCRFHNEFSLFFELLIHYLTFTFL